MLQSENQFLDFYRAGFQAMVDVTKASVQGAERLRSQQLKSLSEALSEASESGKQLSGVLGSPQAFERLFEMQSRFAPEQMERAIGYWSGLYAEAARSQVELLQQMQAKASSLTEAYCATLDAAPRGSESVVAPLKSAAAAMCSAYTMTARATEEAARLAVSQIESANANVREASQAAGRAGAEASSMAAEAGKAASQPVQAAQNAGNPANPVNPPTESRRKSA